MPNPQTPNSNDLLKYKNTTTEKREVIPYLIAFGKGYSVTIIETPSGFFLRVKSKQGDKEVKENLQLDILRLLEATSRIRERLSRVVKA